MYTKRDQIEKDGEDLELWGKLCPSVMSDIETDDESGLKKLTLIWRAPEVFDLISRCDLGLVRVYGMPSERLPDLKYRDSISSDYFN